MFCNGILFTSLLESSDFEIFVILTVFYLLTTLFIEFGLREAMIEKNDAALGLLKISTDAIIAENVMHPK